VDVYNTKSVVTGKWDLYQKDLMKWRWKLIKKQQQAAAKGMYIKAIYILCNIHACIIIVPYIIWFIFAEVEVRDVPEEHFINEEEQDVYDPLDEDNYMLLADDENSDNDAPEI
jgi:hypothetical protein